MNQWYSFPVIKLRKKKNLLLLVRPSRMNQYHRHLVVKLDQKSKVLLRVSNFLVIKLCQKTNCKLLMLRMNRCLVMKLDRRSQLLLIAWLWWSQNSVIKLHRKTNLKLLLLVRPKLSQNPVMKLINQRSKLLRLLGEKKRTLLPLQVSLVKWRGKKQRRLLLRWKMNQKISRFLLKGILW